VTLLDKRLTASVDFVCNGKTVKYIDSYCGPIPRLGEKLVNLSGATIYRVREVSWRTSPEEWMGLHCVVSLDEEPIQ
jgi:hypothetical protein